jgi:hypothetical protein
VILAALAAAPVAHAQNNFRQLRKEISELAVKVTEAEKALSDADTKVNENNRAYEDALKKDPARAQAIKTEGVNLRKAAETAQKNRDSARRALMDKQVELRNSAGGHAVNQLSAQGAWAPRINEARLALEAWTEALSSLPEVPQVRKPDPDPDVTAAQKKGDRERLAEFDRWAAAEEARIKTDIERCDKLIGAEAQVRGEDDGPALVSESKKLKETLQSRQKTLADLRRTAADRLRDLK